VSGVERVPLRVPEQWDPKWFRDFVRDVLAPADARNALGQSGITVSGGPTTPAVIEGLGAVTASDTDTIDVTVASQDLTIDARLQMSLTSDANGIKLAGDEAGPAEWHYYGTDGAAARGWHPLYPTFWTQHAADYTLTSTTSAQQLFNQSANGRVTLATGCYEFALFLYLLDMSATSGAATIDIDGAGTAVTDRWGWASWGIDDSSPLNAATRTGSAAISSNLLVVAPTTGTGMVVSARGQFRVSSAGYIRPAIALADAAAARVAAGSWFAVRQIGESGDSYVGAWS
jgi:hypothetical protein